MLLGVVSKHNLHCVMKAKNKNMVGNGDGTGVIVHDGNVKGTVTVETKQDVAEQEHLLKLAELAQAVILGHVEVSGRYLSLCEHIRSHNIKRAQVAEMLEPLGFPQPRISEIYRVATAPADAWTEYRTRRLGFNKVLNLTRGTLSLVMPNGDGVRADWIAQIPEEGSEARERQESLAGIAKPSALDVALGFARKLARLAEDEKWRKREFAVENGYVVKVSRASARASKRHLEALAK